jgi:O-antigen ligase/polysaccharide polymerase Wzy-like membrane protein
LADAAFGARGVSPSLARGPAAQRRIERREESGVFWTKALVVVVVLAWTAGLAVGFQRALAFLTLVGFASAIAGLARPALGLMGIGLLCSLDGFARTLIMNEGGILRWNTFNYWLLVVMLVNVPVLLRLRDPHSRLLAAFIVVLALGLVASSLRSEGMETTLSIASSFGILVYAIRAAGARNAWSGLALVTGTAGAAGSLVFLLQRDRFPSMNPNVWVFCPLTGIFAIALGLPAVRRKGTAFLLGLLGIINMAWVFLTGSRGGIALALIAMGYVFLKLRSAPARVAALAAGILLAGFLTARFAGLDEYSRHRLNKALDTSEGLRERTSGRSDLMLGAWYMFLDHPLGVGTGGFSTSWSKLGIRPGMSDYAYGAAKEAHAAWAKTLAENGFPGFLLLLFYVGSFSVAAVRRDGTGARALGFLTTFVLLAAFFSTEFAGKGLWLLAGSAVAFLWYRPRRTTRANRSPSPGFPPAREPASAGVGEAR